MNITLLFAYSSGILLMNSTKKLNILLYKGSLYLSGVKLAKTPYKYGTYTANISSDYSNGNY